MKQRAFFLTLLFFSAIALYSFLPSLLLGGVLAIFFSSSHDFLIRKKISPFTASILITIFATFSLIVPLALLILVGFKAINKELPMYQTYFNQFDLTQFSMGVPQNVVSFLQTYIPIDTEFINQTALSLLKGTAEKSTELITTFLAQLPNAFIFIMVSILSLLFCLEKRDAIQSLLKKISPFQLHETHFLIEKGRQIVRSLILANVVVGIIQALIFGLGCWIVGLSNIGLISFAVFILSFVPIVGSFPLTIGIVVYVFLTQSLGVVLLIFSIIVALVDYFVRPIFLRSGASLHPIVTIFSIVAGLSLMGFPGLFIGPIFSGLLIEIYHLSYPD